MHLIGFVIRIYHDARSSECQIPTENTSNNHDFIFITYISAHTLNRKQYLWRKSFEGSDVLLYKGCTLSTELCEIAYRCQEIVRSIYDRYHL
jgi:hypothetical protein